MTTPLAKSAPCRVERDEWWLENPPIETDERGQLRYELYGQDGSRVAMTLPDTRDNRRFIIWVRQHDRYTPRAPLHHLPHSLSNRDKASFGLPDGVGACHGERG